MQFQHMCGMRRGGHVKRVYIYLYICMYIQYTWIICILNMRSWARPQPWNVCLHTCYITSQHLWGQQRVWELHCTAPSAGCAFFFPPSVEEPLLQFSDRRLESGVCGWIQWAGGKIFPLLSSRAPLCSRDFRQSDFCSVWMYRSSSQVKVHLYLLHLRAFGWDQDFFSLNLHQVLFLKLCRISL